MNTNPRHTGSALIITLLVVSVLTVIVIAFVTSMSIERLTATSYKMLAVAQMAADSAVEDAVQRIEREQLPTSFYLIGSQRTAAGMAPITVLGRKNLTKAAECAPLVSADIVPYYTDRTTSPTALADLAARLAADAGDPAKVTDMNFVTGPGVRALNSMTGAPQYPAAWRYLSDASGTKTARYAFFVDDEQSKINLRVAGGAAGDKRNKEVLDGSDIVVSGSEPFLLNAAELLKLKGFPGSAGITLANYGQAFDSRSKADLSRDVLTALEGTETDLIPAGYFDANGLFVDYPEAGKPKYPINEMATKPSYGATATDRASAIANVIGTNLPKFKLRDASFGKFDDATRYTRRIAASIVDYIDTDSTTTLLPDGEPAGMDLQGVLSAVIERYKYLGAIATPGGGWDVSVEHTVYVELWNPYNSPVSGQFKITLTSLRNVAVPRAIQKPLDLYEATVAASLRANEFKVFALAPKTTHFEVPPGGGPTQPTGPTMPQTGTDSNGPLHSRFRAEWNGSLCNWTPNGFGGIPVLGPGLVKGEVAAMVVNQAYWAGNLPPHVLTTTGRGYRAVADPRQNYCQNYNWANRSPTSPDFLMNGRSNYAITGPGTGQDFRNMWIGRDFLPVSPILGKAMLSTGTPDAVGSNYTAAEATKAPSVIMNQYMRSIGELGNIYDPANVSETGMSAYAGDPEAWSVSGGGRTLRVGQPERPFRYDSLSYETDERRPPQWMTAGLDANQLLDLFSVKPIDASKVPGGPFRLNLNTARKEALVALLRNLQPVDDPLYQSSVITLAKAGELAQKIIDERPYNNYGEIRKAMDFLVAPQYFEPSLGPTVFAYPTYLGGNRAVDTALAADRTVEGTFRRIAENIGVTSHRLRVVIVGQALSPKGKVQSQQREEVLLQLEPAQSAAGTRVRTTVLSRKIL